MEIGILKKFIRDKIVEYKVKEPARQGTIKGNPIGFMLPKFAAAALSLTNVKVKIIAEQVGVSYGMLRVWRTEPLFHKTMGELAEEFAKIFWVEAIKYFQIECQNSSRNIYEQNFSDVHLYGDSVLISILESTPLDLNHIYLLKLCILLDRHGSKTDSTNESRKRVNWYIKSLNYSLYNSALTIIQQPEISEEEKNLIFRYLLHNKPG